MHTSRISSTEENHTHGLELNKNRGNVVTQGDMKVGIVLGGTRSSQYYSLMLNINLKFRVFVKWYCTFCSNFVFCDTQILVISGGYRTFKSLSRYIGSRLLLPDKWRFYLPRLWPSVSCPFFYTARACTSNFPHLWLSRILPCLHCNNDTMSFLKRKQDNPIFHFIFHLG